MRTNRLIYTLLILLGMLFSACDMVDYHPYDVDVYGATDINARNIGHIEALCADKDTIRFVAMGDSQGFYDETRDFVNAVNRRGDVDFVVHGGDFTDYGTVKEFLWQRDIFDRLKVPYVGLIGNHDCLGTGKDTFRALWGDSNFSFVAGNVKFVCLNTNALEYDYSEAIPDFDFIAREIADTVSYAPRTVVCMHARPYSDVFNNNVALPFNHYLKELPGLMFCFNAHGHNAEVEDIYDDGTLYYQCDCMESRTYLLFTITPEGYEYEMCRY